MRLLQSVFVVYMVLGLGGMLVKAQAGNCESFARAYAEEARKIGASQYEIDPSEYADYIGTGHACIGWNSEVEDIVVYEDENDVEEMPSDDMEREAEHGANEAENIAESES